MAVEADSPSPPLTEVADMSWPYPAVSPDGMRIAFRKGEDLTVINRQTGKQLQNCPLDGWKGLLSSWSPDGKQIAFGSYGGMNRVGLWILDVASGRKVKVVDGPCTMPAWSPDGTKFGFQVREGDDSSVWMLDAKALADLNAKLQ